MGALWSLLFGERVSVDGNSYRIVRRIGEGGFSYVSLARTVRDGSTCALKEILLQEPQEQEAAVRREVSFYQAVDHPNVIGLIAHEVRLHRGHLRAYLVFPYYQEGTLEDMIAAASQKHAPIPEPVVLSMFLSACEGLHALHCCQDPGPLSHRDIKPGNLLVKDGCRELVLMDLGSVAPARINVCSRQEAIALQELAAQTCTANYRAPELFQVPSNSEVTEAVDIWSLGCTLFEAAFWIRCFDGSATASVSGRVPLPNTHAYSAGFVELIHWMLQVEPHHRPSCTQIKERILQLLDATT